MRRPVRGAVMAHDRRRTRLAYDLESHAKLRILAGKGVYPSREPSWPPRALSPCPIDHPERRIISAYLTVCVRGEETILAIDRRGSVGLPGPLRALSPDELLAARRGRWACRGPA